MVVLCGGYESVAYVGAAGCARTENKTLKW